VTTNLMGSEMNIQRIQIQTEEKPRTSPAEIPFSSVARRSEIIRAELFVKRWLEDARELRAMMTKLNGSSPVAIPHDSGFDEAIAFAEDLVSNLQGLPDAICDRYGGDR
jgi:hypothetical protein